MAFTIKQRVVNYFGNSMRHVVVGERITDDTILEHHHFEGMHDGVAVYPVKIPNQHQNMSIHVAMVMPSLDKQLYNNILLEFDGKFSIHYANIPEEVTPSAPQKKLFSGDYTNKPR